MLVFPGWNIGGENVPVEIMINDTLYNKAAAAAPEGSRLFRSTSLRSSYDDAINYMNQTIIPAMATALSLYGISMAHNRPVVAYGNSEFNGPFGMVRLKLFSGNSNIVIKAPTGNNGPTIQTTWSDPTNEQTSNEPFSVSFPKINSFVVRGSDYGHESCSISVLPSTVFTDGVYNGGSCMNCSVTLSLDITKLSSTVFRVTGEAEVGFTSTTTISSTVTSVIGGIKAVEDSDPYAQGQESDSEAPAGSSPFTGIGGNGSFTGPGASGGIPSLPTLSAVDTGLLALYCSASEAGLRGLASYLWSSAFDLDTFKKLFADPMQLIIGAAILPCTPTTASSVIIFGNVNTGISMPRATSQYVSVDCGTITLQPPYTGTFLDYAPHSKYSIYLPYIGTRELNANEIVGKKIGVVYHVDVLTGACVAFIYYLDRTNQPIVLYEYSGSCAVQIPITSSNWASVLQSLATIGGAAIGGFAAGGPMGAVVAGGVSAASNAASGGLTPSFQRGGSVSGSAGLLADQNPYLIVELPNICKASNQNWFEGYPNYTTMYLNQCSGYTKVHEINLEGIGCTRSELSEIESLLKEGVII